MSGRRRSAMLALLLLMGMLASTAVAEPGREQANLVQHCARQYPSLEPPISGMVPPAAGLPQESPDPPPPVVAIRVRKPSAIALGRELEYHVFVENNSQSEAHHVVVRIPMPTNVRYKTANPAPQSDPSAAKGILSWDFGTLKGGQRREIVFVVEPTGGDEIVCSARVTFEHGECVRTRIAKPMLQVRTTGAERAVLYDIPAYTIEVTNTGLADAKEVVLTEELPPGLDFSDSNPSTNGANPLTWKLGTLAPGERRRVEFKVIAKANGLHPLKAAVTADGLKAAEENLIHVVVGEAKLTLVMTGPRSRSLDRAATYWLTISNPGSVPATNIQLADELFSNERLRSSIEFVSATDGGKLTGNDIRWSLGSLAPGARRTVSLTLRALREGEFNNVASIKADRGLSARAYAGTAFTPPLGLTLDIEKESDPIAVEKPMTFTFRVRQRGGSSMKKVSLAVILPEDMQVLEARGKTADSTTGRTVTFEALPELASGEEAVYIVKVRTGHAGMKQVLRATVTTDPLPPGGELRREEDISVIPESASLPLENAKKK